MAISCVAFEHVRIGAQQPMYSICDEKALYVKTYTVRVMHVAKLVAM